MVSMRAVFTRFNPRPPSLTGELVPLHQAVAFHKGFNPRPPSLTGEHVATRMELLLCAFQSTPAIADGRTTCALSSSS